MPQRAPEREPTQAVAKGNRSEPGAKPGALLPTRGSTPPGRSRKQPCERCSGAPSGARAPGVLSARERCATGLGSAAPGRGSGSLLRRRSGSRAPGLLPSRGALLPGPGALLLRAPAGARAPPVFAQVLAPAGIALQAMAGSFQPWPDHFNPGPDGARPHEEATTGPNLCARSAGQKDPARPARGVTTSGEGRGSRCCGSHFPPSRELFFTCVS